MAFLSIFKTAKKPEQHDEIRQSINNALNDHKRASERLREVLSGHCSKKGLGL